MHFHIVVGRRRQRNEQKSVMHMQMGCFASQTYFLKFLLLLSSLLQKLPIKGWVLQIFPAYYECDHRYF